MKNNAKKLKALAKRVKRLEAIVFANTATTSEGRVEPKLAADANTAGHRELTAVFSQKLYCRKTIMQEATLVIADDGDWTASVTVYNTSRHRKFKVWAYMSASDADKRQVGERIVVELGNIGHHQTSTWTESGRNAAWAGAGFDRLIGGLTSRVSHVRDTG